MSDFESKTGFAEQAINSAQDNKETPAKDKSTKIREGIFMLLVSYPLGLVVGMLSSILFIPTILFQAWVITKIQSWHPLQDVGVPTLSMHQAVGALLILGALRCIFISSKANVKFSGSLQKEYETASVINLVQFDNDLSIGDVLKLLGKQVASFSVMLAVAWAFTWFV